MAEACVHPIAASPDRLVPGRAVLDRFDSPSLYPASARVCFARRCGGV